MDLISEAAGGRIVDCNDEFFAEAANLIKSADPVWRDGEYTDRGKWMDGWETRRRRDAGHDWCVIALGVPGRIGSVTMDTSFFTGNFPEEFSLDACGVGADDRVTESVWSEVIPRTRLQGDSIAAFEVTDPHRVTHVRLNIYPDGGVARLRVEGDPIPSMSDVCAEGETDLVSATVGGVALAASDRHYSDPSNLLRRTRPIGMWDGWETRRRRGPGHDWSVFRLGLAGSINKLVVDTTHFKGNSPGWVSLDVSDDGERWRAVVDRHEVSADAINEISLSSPARASYVRLSIHPDGGVARLRVLGTVDPLVASLVRVEYLSSLFNTEAERFFYAACASTAWVSDMTIGRPYDSPDHVLDSARSAFDSLSEQDWLEAFAAHPRIGERGDAQANREQSGTASASREIIARLGAVNEEYESKFGFTYIVSATGKTAEEMLHIAEQRLANSRRQEIASAASEQRSITETRLRRMLCMETR